MLWTKSPSFIFIHIPKTGGTSVEHVLCERIIGKKWGTFSKAQADEYIVPQDGTIYQHWKLRDYIREKRVKPDDFFTFTFVRNPWDLVISEIMYLRKYQKEFFNHKDIADSILQLVNFSGHMWGHDFSPQVEYLTNEFGDFCIDYIGRFEHLQQHFNEVCDQLGIERTQLPMTNTSKERPHYSDYYNNDTRKLVAERFSADIEAFGYEFNICTRTISLPALSSKILSRALNSGT